MLRLPYDHSRHFLREIDRINSVCPKRLVILIQWLIIICLIKLAITWAYNYNPSSCVVTPSWFHSKGLASDAIRSKPHPVAKAIYLKKLRSSQLLSSEGTGGAHVHLCYQRSNKRPKPRRSLIIQPDNLNTTGRYRHYQLLLWTQHPSKTIKHMKHHKTLPMFPHVSTAPLCGEVANKAIIAQMTSEDLLKAFSALVPRASAHRCSVRCDNNSM